MKLFYTLLMVFAVSYYSGAQILEKETIFDLSKKEAGTAAYNGYPDDIVIDNEKKQIELVFVTKSKPKFLSQNRLIFDFDLNYKETTTEEFELVKGGETPEAVKKTNPNFKGEFIETTKLEMVVNLAGAGTIQKTKETSTYNWDKNAYDVESELLEKVKTKDLFGKRIYNPYLTHCNDPETGDLIYVSGIINKDLSTSGYSIERANLDLEITEVGTIPFEYMQRFFYGGWIVTPEGDWDLIMIFANAGGKGVYKPKKNQSPVVNGWTYVRMRANGKVINTAKFETKVNNWNILGSKLKDGSIYIYGPGETKDVGEEHQSLMAAIGTGKQDAFQVLKITGNNIDFVAGPTLDEMNSKAAKPDSQKKIIEYNGRSIEFREFNFASNGDLFISAQDWTKDLTTTLPLYNDLFMFHFSADGSFKRLYGINSIKDVNKIKGALDRNTDPRFYPDEGSVVESVSGAMYWNIFGVKDVSKYVSTSYSYNVETTTTTWIPRFSGAIAKFDVESGTLDEFQKLGNDDFMLYRLPNTGTLVTPFDNGTKMLYIGFGGEKGRQLWLGKMDPAKM